MSDIFLIKRNDTSPALEAQIQDSAKQPVPLFGATVVFNMGTSDGDVLVNRGAVEILDDATGLVKYSWVAADTVEAGTHRGEFEVTFADGKVETFPKSQTASKNFIRIVIPEDV